MWNFTHLKLNYYKNFSDYTNYQEVKSLVFVLSYFIRILSAYRIFFMLSNQFYPWKFCEDRKCVLIRIEHFGMNSAYDRMDEELRVVRILETLRIVSLKF